MVMACSGIFAGTHMFIHDGVGSFSTLSVAVMLKEAVATGQYEAVTGFAIGFILARVLEGPLVGILDIGGSLMTGVGVGIPALFLSLGAGFVLENFFVALLVGACIGFVLSMIILSVRLAISKGGGGYGSMGTDIMMGAGNIVGKWFGPILVITAGKYSPITGIGALLGGAYFYKVDKPIIGGAVIGALVAGAFNIYVLGNPMN